MFTYEMRPSRIMSVGAPRGRREPRARRGGAARRGSRGRGRRSRARPRASGAARRWRRRGRAHRRSARRRERCGRSRPAARPGARQRRGAFAEVDAGDLARLEALAGAVEDVVRDLEGDAERESEPPERGVAAAGAEQAGGLEQLRRLQLTACEVALDGRVGIVGLAPLQRLAPCEAERGVGELRDGVRVAGRGQLGEGTGEQVIAGGARGVRPVGGPGGGAATAKLRAVDQVVVDERRHVD